MEDGRIYFFFLSSNQSKTDKRPFTNPIITAGIMAITSGMKARLSLRNLASFSLSLESVVLALLLTCNCVFFAYQETSVSQRRERSALQRPQRAKLAERS